MLGGRTGWDIAAPTHFKRIPRAAADVGAGANWLVEAAFPVTVRLHTGIAF